MATRVLLAEDDSDDKDLFISFYLERKDISIIGVVSNGLELIDYLTRVENDEQLPDLIVLDQNMPLMNGKRSLQFLKTHERFAAIPAVVYSTYADANLVLDCKNLGAQMVASKPIDNEGYQKMMDDFLKAT